MSSIPKMIQALQIMLEEVPRLVTEDYSFGAEHDVICFYVDTADLPEDSEAGQKLVELGLHVDGDGWQMYV